MDSPVGQDPQGHGATTRGRLLAAAADLIAEMGWGRVTTRAVAERAGLPHGAVSYHFRGKQSMLVEAAAAAVEEMFPDSELTAVESVEELFAWTSEAGAGSARAGVLLEAMREASRDEQLRDRIAAVLGRLRLRVAEIVAVEGGSSPRPAGSTAADVATAIVAAGDGLWLHSLLDPRLDVSGATAALSRLAKPGTEEGRR
ncbi:TetR/AcrR family transcriptional regulator [Microbacterium sp. MPKO10]|uniref:TetR/AcrR family transcriptional regulator n=1 Tax=Microbacterium sp. MPKO10 TaxID=2989818 RepID=UPI00223556B9|nr:TetR/AcrR family transcriptional regulator [Microbacterium sp. MPKO10]MCW4457973.1 TetR family transcriptional regulator [Microbacterium sp. MPKO10]